MLATATLVALGLALGAAHILLLSPMVSRPPCGRTIILNSHARFALSCDSPEFMVLAAHPSLLLVHNEGRQSRPGYVFMGAIATRTVGSALMHTPVPRAYGGLGPAYVALVLLNLVMLAGGLAAYFVIGGLAGVPRVVMAFGAMPLLFNDVVKAFFWSPQQQMLNIALPIWTVALVFRILVSARPRRSALLLTGLGIGVAALVYGTAVIAVGAVLLALTVRQWRQGARARLAAAVEGLLLVALPAAAVQVAWILACIRLSGGYFNSEVTVFRQFVWVVDAARHGWPTLWVTWFSYTVTAIRVEWAANWLLLVVLAAGVLILQVRYSLDALRSGRTRALLVACACVCVPMLAFVDLQGVYMKRIEFGLTPILVIVASLVYARVLAGGALPRAAAFGAGAMPIIGACAAELARLGPPS